MPIRCEKCNTTYHHPKTRILHGERKTLCNICHDYTITISFSLIKFIQKPLSNIRRSYMFKSKVFWTGLAAVATGVTQIIGKQYEIGMQTLIGGFALIFVRHTLHKQDKVAEKLLNQNTKVKTKKINP